MRRLTLLRRMKDLLTSTFVINFVVLLQFLKVVVCMFLSINKSFVPRGTVIIFNRTNSIILSDFLTFINMSDMGLSKKLSFFLKKHLRRQKPETTNN